MRSAEHAQRTAPSAHSTQHYPLLKDEAMRTIVGLIAVLGMTVAVAHAQPPRVRGASFRPPEPLGPNEAPTGTVARGASDEFPPSSFLPSTPVTRPSKGVADGRGPAWLSGVDPNVLPAAGSASKGNNVRPLSPSAAAPETKEDPFTLPKGLEKLKGAVRPQPTTATQPPQPQPTAENPYRGTGTNGAPVYAGPPAYRWFGWGTVTPGANQFAPTGQYPKASATWYSITGATPGAFPVPVMNPLRDPPGTEPPNYATAKPSAPPSNLISAGAPPASVQPHPAPPVETQPRPLPIERPEPPKFNPTGESKFAPGSTPPVAVPKLSTPPMAAAPVALAPVPPPVLPPVVPEPAPVVIAPPAPFVPPAPPKADPVAIAPPVVPAPAPVIPPPVFPTPTPVFPSVEPPKPVATETPNPFPISVTTEPKPEEPARPAPKPPEPRREEHKWQAAPEPTQPAPGTWAPASVRPAQPAPAAPPAVPAAPATGGPAWKSGTANVQPVVARGQAPDATPDPIETLIRQMCQGRADGVDIRWAGTKKVMVCFEVRTAAEAQKLVTDISRRPELSPYQIDFCAVVKR